MNVYRFRDLRQSNNLLQKDIAKLLNTTQQVYSEYELGIRLMPLDKLDKLATFYKTSTDYLIGRTNEKKPYPEIKN